jgi:hypothetical protein
MEQLRDVLAGLSRNEAVRLDFYEQGIERVVTFVPQEQCIRVECTDMIKKPSSRTETSILSRNAVVNELVGLCDTFLIVSKKHSADLANHPWFVVWAFELHREAEALRHAVIKV